MDQGMIFGAVQVFNPLSDQSWDSSPPNPIEPRWILPVLASPLPDGAAAGVSAIPKGKLTLISVTPLSSCIAPLYTAAPLDDVSSENNSQVSLACRCAVPGMRAR